MNAIMHEKEHEKKVRDMTASMLDKTYNKANTEQVLKEIFDRRNNIKVIDIDDLLNKLFD